MSADLAYLLCQIIAGAGSLLVIEFSKEKKWQVIGWLCILFQLLVFLLMVGMVVYARIIEILA